ncbi:MAG: alpha/beta fold hydrolase [Gemmatimonadota bacterium]|nr:alpha/beta fold hydrolase [Gemmatimonadota bacterium]
MILPFITAAAAAILGVLWRRSHIRRLERDCLTRRPLGLDGIIVGAQPFEFHATGGRAVLLVHGGGDTPQTVRYLADVLHARGYAVRAPLLPGHGRTIRHFADVTADAWLDSVRAEYCALRARHSWVGVIGVSMGGALAVQLAAEVGGELPALGLVAPYLSVPASVRRAARLAPLWGSMVPYVRSTSGHSIRDPAEAARNLAYGVFTPAALRALTTTADRASALLPRVTAPTLVIQSREDNRIAPGACEQSFRALGAREKRLVWIDGAGHIITVDRGREKVFAELADWLDQREVGGGKWEEERRKRAGA